MKISFLIICLLLPAVASAAEGVKKWEMNEDQSAITFSVAIEASPVEGAFPKFTTVIAFDPQNLNQSQVDVQIDLSHIEAGYRDVAENLKKKDWFDVDNFPRAHFVGRHFKHLGGAEYEVAGDLTLRGITRPETLLFTLTRCDDHQAAITGRMAINRLDYGVGQGGWQSLSSVGGQVFLSVTIAAKGK